MIWHLAIMLDKFQKIEARFKELEALLADGEVAADQGRYQKLAKEFSDLTPVIEVLKTYRTTLAQDADLKQLLKEKHDREFEDLAKLELEELSKQIFALEARMTAFLRPKKPGDDKDVIMEIRAGTGGEEASLFAANLFRMYTRYAERKGWKSEVMSTSVSEAGGFKEVIFGITGKSVGRHLKWESGAHRVQRVPTTEASGRIHTSAATVAVMFEADEIEISLDPKDLKIDVFRSSGPGGQSVNTTDSAVRITHLPTGTVVVCQDERSQLKNKAKAMRVLRARIMDKLNLERNEKEMRDRKAKVGTGDRSEKIRTYNFSDRRVTDHRIGFSTYRLPEVLDGDMDELIEALWKAELEADMENAVA